MNTHETHGVSILTVSGSEGSEGGGEVTARPTARDMSEDPGPDTDTEAEGETDLESDAAEGLRAFNRVLTWETRASTFLCEPFYRAKVPGWAAPPLQECNEHYVSKRRGLLAHGWSAPRRLAAHVAAPGFEDFLMPSNLKAVTEDLVVSHMPVTAGSLAGVLAAFDVGLVVTCTPLPLFVPGVPESTQFAANLRGTYDSEYLERPDHADFYEVCMRARASGVVFLHTPTTDAHVLRYEDLGHLVRAANTAFAAGKTVWAHCWAGMFRSWAAVYAILHRCVMPGGARSPMCPLDVFAGALAPDSGPAPVQTRDRHRALLRGVKCRAGWSPGMYDSFLETWVEPWLWWTHPACPPAPRGSPLSWEKVLGWSDTISADLLSIYTGAFRHVQGTLTTGLCARPERLEWLKRQSVLALGAGLSLARVRSLCGHSDLRVLGRFASLGCLPPRTRVFPIRGVGDPVPLEKGREVELEVLVRRRMKVADVVTVRWFPRSEGGGGPDPTREAAEAEEALVVFADGMVMLQREAELESWHV
jgi:hypothetical protein